MITVVTPDLVNQYSAIVAEMFRLRCKSSGNFLSRNETDCDFQIDKYDVLEAIYLIAQNDQGKVCGSIRLLPSTGTTMLEDVFSALINPEKYKKSTSIWELSHLTVDSELKDREIELPISPYMLELFIGMLEYGIMNGWSDIVTVVDLQLEKILDIARWPLRRIGEERKIESKIAVAGLLQVSQTILNQVKKSACITCSPLKDMPKPKKRNRHSYNKCTHESQSMLT
jgi:acyl homoserine lactone synthase